MIALIQRVSRAKVTVADEVTGAIDKGLLVLLGVERQDDMAAMEKLATKVMNYRVFSDDNGKMNLNLTQVGGQLLVVSAIYPGGRYQPRSASQFLGWCQSGSGRRAL